MSLGVGDENELRQMEWRRIYVARKSQCNNTDGCSTWCYKVDGLELWVGCRAPHGAKNYRKTGGIQ